MIVKRVFLCSLHQFIQFASSLKITLLKYLQMVNLIFFTHDSNSSVKMLFR